MALLVYLIIFFIFALLLLLIGKFNQPFEKALVGYTRLYNYIMKLFVIDIKEEFEDLTITTPIIISNHVNWFDIFYMVLRLLPISFISKGDVANYPLIGTLARAINCIFLDRKDTENRKSAVQDIKQRIIDYNNKIEGAFPLIIFPEGTTSNGKGILKFKMGAFENLSEITAFCLHYECKLMLTQVKTLTWVWIR